MSWLIPSARNFALAVATIWLIQRVSYVQNVTGKVL